MIGSMPWGYACPDLLWQPRKAGEIWECWQVLLIVGGFRNGAAEAVGFKPRHGNHAGGTHVALARRTEPHSFGAPFARQLRKLETKM